LLISLLREKDYAAFFLSCERIHHPRIFSPPVPVAIRNIYADQAIKLIDFNSGSYDW